MATKKKSGSEVISVVPTTTFAVKYKDVNDGDKEKTCLVMSFGTHEDGRPGVFVIANNQQMQANLLIAPELRKAVLDFLAKSAPVTADDIPDAP